MNMFSLLALAAGLAAVVPPAAVAAPATIRVAVDQPSHAVSPTLWGLFFEDINCSVDGGIYAELVRNRSFEDADSPEYWTLVAEGDGRGTLSVRRADPAAADPFGEHNRQSLRVEIEAALPREFVGVSNQGYWGIPVEAGARYLLSFHARGERGFAGPLRVELRGADGRVCASGAVAQLSGDWAHYELALVSAATDTKSSLVLGATQPGAFDLDMVSLFPAETWKGRGLRADLMEKLDGLAPSFFRFPGGCWVEGDTMEFAYRWKQTIGDPAQRRTQHNIWNYQATHGVGFHEYLQISEDLGAEPLFVINCGMSHREVVPMEDMGPYVQDALDAIEYCNGSTNTPYGALRARNGHPAPFHLKYLEIGNENGGPPYIERWALFYDAIKAKYPDLVLIADQWGGQLRDQVPEIVDEHYYSTPEFFIQRATLYDTYDRNGPKVYVGEYAVTQNAGQGNLRGAIGEAAFMTGLERNSDVVAMACYAPLFANVNYKRWNPDLICYDNTRSYVLPSYHVQRMFSRHRGDVVLPVTVDAPAGTPAVQGGSIGIGTWATRAEFKDLTITHDGQTLPIGTSTLGEWKTFGGAWAAEDGLLRQTDQEATNVRAILPDLRFTNYTYSLKARKLGGEEGFLVLFNVNDPEQKSWWNLGGWGNARHALEFHGMTSGDRTGQIETDRWYDIRIEVAGPQVKCFLDGKLTTEGSTWGVEDVHASATRVNASGEVIVKVVNSGVDARETEIVLAEVGRLAGTARAIQLTSDDSTAENSLDHPDRVAPRTFSLPVDGHTLRATLPGNSFTVFRVGAE